MPDYRFYIESGNRQSRIIAFDLPNTWAVDAVAKHVARDLAAEELRSGSLYLAHDMAVLDADNVVVARYPLRDFIRVG